MNIFLHNFFLNVRLEFQFLKTFMVFLQMPRSNEELDDQNIICKLYWTIQTAI